MDFRVLREALRRQRAAKGFTLDQAAAASGVNRHTIHKIENVKRQPHVEPDLDTIEKLARAYDLTLSAFFAHIDGSTAAQGSRRAADVEITDARGVLPAAQAALLEFIDTLGAALQETRARLARPHAATAPRPAAQSRRHRRPDQKSA